MGDGSGLSVDNRITCATMLAVLQHAGFEGPVGQGLAIGGQTGTLADAFGDTTVAGRIRGKTGTLNNVPYDQDPPAVKALSGYLPVEGGGAIEYTLLLNGGIITDQSEYRPIWAELVTALDLVPRGRQPGSARTAMTAPARSGGRRAAPVGVLVGLAAVPAVVLAGMWQFADANVPPATTTTTTTVAPPPHRPSSPPTCSRTDVIPTPLAEASGRRRDPRR